MRRIGLIAAAGLCVLPALGDAQAADQNGRLYYKDGTRLEFDDFDMRINLQVQPRFTYEDNDEEGRREAGLDEENDVMSFDLRRVRLNFTGNLLKKQFSYQVQTDLRSDQGGNELKDAWLQWNGDGVNLRWGQTKVPFSRQFLVSSANLEFIERSIASEAFDHDRQIGMLLHGPIGDAGTYYIGGFNGESEGEGDNRPGVDNNLLVSAAANFNVGEYGSRAMEGDLRPANKRDELAMTFGAAVTYGEATGDPFDVGGDFATDFDKFDLNVDAGLRFAGWSLQTEFYYAYAELDEKNASGDYDNLDNFGFYVQGGYLFTEEWELAVRYALVQPDDEIATFEDLNEISAVLNYFLNGHNLKLQVGGTWEFSNFNEEVAGTDDDISDFRFETQLAGYF